MSTPHTIAVPIYDGLLAFEYSIAREILGRDRRHLVPAGSDMEWYDFVPCRVEPGRLRSSHGFEIRPDGDLDTLMRADTVLVTGWRETLERPPQPFLDALVSAHARGARLVSICTGVFPLAYAGILDGRSATTHWIHSDTLRQRFPTIRVDDDALYIHDRDGAAVISSSAGSAAGLDLCLALVREDFGLTVANTIARRMVAPAHREGGQSQYAESPAGVAEDDHFGPVLDWMLGHLDQTIFMERVASRFGYSLRTFQRRCKEITGMSPHKWLVEQRVASARTLLESTDWSVERVATASGLGSAANLRKHLGRALSTTPRAYRSAFRAAS